MAVKRVIDIVRYIDKCIRSGSAWSLKEMAGKIGISERRLYNYIKLMKKFGAPIDYIRKRRTYIYKKPGSFFIGFVKEQNDSENIKL